MLYGTARLFGQAGTGTITGTVTDPSAAAVDGAVIRARDPQTGFTRSTVSNESGNYSLPGLRPAAYDVTVEFPGFRRHSQADFRIEVDQAARLDIQLQVGQVTEQVEVRSAAQLLHTENAAVGGVIEQRKITDLPLNGRDFVQLALLVPGVTTGQPGAGAGGGISIGGARSEQNAFQLDGVTNSDQWDNALSFRPSIDAIQEFKIEVNNYSAEFGKGAGGQINVVTKSGTNQLHGALYEFNRNDVVQARNFFQRDPNFVDSQGRFIAPPYNRNEFGAAAGGPVIRDRTFFFAYYDGLRNVRGQTGRRNVPDDALRRGDFSTNLGRSLGVDSLGRPVLANMIYDPRTARTVPGSARYVRDPFPANRIPADRFDPVSARIVQRTDLWPAPNTAGERDAGTGNPRQNYADGRSNRSTSDQTMGRVDHRFSANDLVYGRFGWGRSDSFSPGNFVGLERTSPSHKHVASGVYTKTLGPTRVNEIRFVYQRENNEGGSRRIFEDVNLVKELGVRGLPLAGPGAPDIPVGGFTSFNDGSETSRKDQTWQGMEMFSFSKGRHFVKLGFEVRRVHVDFLNNPANTRGNFDFANPEWTGLEGFPGTGNTFANFLLGLPRQKSRRPGDHSSFLRAAEYAGYVQDDFKATSRLTVNLGLRYQLYFSPKETRDHISALRVNPRPTSFAQGGIFLCKDPQRCASISRTSPVLGLGLTLGDLQADRLPQVVLAGRDVPRSLSPIEKYDFGPRIGIAYRLGSNTVVRTGYGLFFDTDPMRNFQDAVENIPFVREDQQSLSAFQFGPPVPEAFMGYLLDDPVIGSFTPGPNTYSINFRNSYVSQWNFGVQRQFGNSFVADVSYAGSKATRLNRRENFNTQEPRAANALISPSVNPHLRRLLPYAVFGGVLVPLDNWFETTATAFANYHALMARFEKRYSRGLTFINAFTWSKAITDAQPFQGGSNDTGNRVQDMFNKRADKGLAAHHHKFRFVTSFVYELPFGRGKAIGGRGSRAISHLIGGWQVNGIAPFQSGFPLTIRRSGDPLGVGTDGAVRPDMVCEPNLTRGERTLQRYFRQDCFSAPSDRFGNAGRSTVIGPGLNSWDLAAIKQFAVRESWKMQFRAEFFNALNHPNWGAPGRDLGAGGFGVVTSAADPRIIQFGLKLLF